MVRPSNLAAGKNMIDKLLYSVAITFWGENIDKLQGICKIILMEDRILAIWEVERKLN